MEETIKEIMFKQLKRLSFLSEAEIMSISIEDVTILSSVMVEITKLLLQELDKSNKISEEMIEKIICEKFEECLAHEE